MPVGPLKNTVYQLLLPVRAPSPKGQMKHETIPAPIRFLGEYEKLLVRHHVLGASLLLRQGDESRNILTSTMLKPVHTVDKSSLFRTASITKMSTAMVTMMLIDDGAFALDTPVQDLLPIPECDALKGITVSHLLSHTSGLRDAAPASDTALRENWPIEQLLAQPGIRVGEPGALFSYCNLNYGLLGCILEFVTNQSIRDVFAERLLMPLGMQGAIDPACLDAARVVPISRVLPYHEGQDMVIPGYAISPLTESDPHHHYHHTAGSLYTDAGSLSRLLLLIAQHGAIDGRQLIRPEIVRQMTRVHGSYGKASPTLHYGLGLLIIEDRTISKHRIIGHQGYAYGCADCAFYEEGTDRQVIFLNGGCSEARTGRLGKSNYELLRFALQKEMPAWK